MFVDWKRENLVKAPYKVRRFPKTVPCPGRRKFAYNKKAPARVPGRRCLFRSSEGKNYLGITLSSSELAVEPVTSTEKVPKSLIASSSDRIWALFLESTETLAVPFA